MYVQYVISLN